MCHNECSTCIHTLRTHLLYLRPLMETQCWLDTTLIHVTPRTLEYIVPKKKQAERNTKQHDLPHCIPDPHCSRIIPIPEPTQYHGTQCINSGKIHLHTVITHRIFTLHPVIRVRRIVSPTGHNIYNCCN